MALCDIFDHKKILDEYLTAFLTEKKEALSDVNSWGTESIARLLPFIAAGKSVRGCLALFSYDMLVKHAKVKLALPLGAGLELIHAGALIHDDIMDGDDTRRHMKAMHIQFQNFSPDKTFGESMAINVGDLCYFLAFEQLSFLKSSHVSQIISLASREFAAVTIAQQFDIASSYLSHQSTKDEIISLYRTKTARYTFSLPLMMGALLANVDDKTLKTLEAFGEAAGILFQIRDDELSIIGDPKKTGKPLGSDEKNHKQTLIANKTKAQIAVIKKQYEDKAVQNIQTLSIDEKHKQALMELVTFCSTRET